MMYRAAAFAMTLAIAGCTSEPVVLHNAGRTVELSGGPASISSTAEAMDYHQPTADGLCRERGYAGAQAAGEKVEAFIASYVFRCTD